MKPGKGDLFDRARFNLAEFLAAEQTVRIQRAVLKSEGQVPDDRFFENAAVNRGVMVKVSNDLKEVVKWLEIRPANKAPAGDHQTPAPKP